MLPAQGAVAEGAAAESAVVAEAAAAKASQRKKPINPRVRSFRVSAPKLQAQLLAGHSLPKIPRSSWAKRLISAEGLCEQICESGLDT